MSRLLLSESDLQASVDLMSSLAKAALEGSTGAGVTVTESVDEVVAGYTDSTIRKADDIQVQLDEGPCLSARKRNIICRIDDMNDDTRWPRWTHAAARLGIASSLSVPLVVGDVPVGTIKTYSKHPGTYDDRHARLLGVFADQAAFVVANVLSFAKARELSGQLNEAMKSRERIGEAMGILMEREGIGEESAFKRLKQMSQDRNVKLRDVAREVVQSTGRN